MSEPASLVYYNDNNAFCAQWLRNLIGAGHLPPGDVDDRSILNVRPDDVAGYEQCHWFSGIGGWPYALKLAGWQGPVWTGSCPCQPLSCVGERQGHADERHVWPAFYALIAELKPPVVFGEQVASEAGREWLAGIRADLEHLGYAVGAADLSAASVGAPHIRQRLFWVANTAGDGWRARASDECEGKSRSAFADDRSAASGMADTSGERRRQVGRGALGDEGADGRQPHGYHFAASYGADCGMGNAASEQVGRAGQSWEDSVWLSCADGKARRIEPSAFPLADGVPARVGRLRAYGNAIVAPLAAEFIKAYMECLN